MQYAVAFLEGIITFISPCLLPMLPIYISYFAGGGERSTKKTLLGALGFVSGFTVIFVAMGTLAGTIGSFLRECKGAVNLISGLIVILFGLNFLGIIKMNLFRGGSKTLNSREMGFFPAMLFGIIFSLGWTPCVGAFLGSALMLASQQGHVIKGMLMLLCYSLGLGIADVFLIGQYLLNVALIPFLVASSVLDAVCFQASLDLQKAGPFQVFPVNTADNFSLRRVNDQIAVSIFGVAKEPVVVDLYLALLIAELDAHSDIGG